LRLPFAPIIMAARLIFFPAFILVDPATQGGRKGRPYRRNSRHLRSLNGCSFIDGESQEVMQMLAHDNKDIRQAYTLLQVIFRNRHKH
jgi:hypothetical protein